MGEELKTEQVTGWKDARNHLEAKQAPVELLLCSLGCWCTAAGWKKLACCAATSESRVQNACSWGNCFVVLCCARDVYTWGLVFVTLYKLW